MLVSLIFAAAILATSDGAIPAAAPAAQPVAAADANKVICHTEETTGTRLGSTRVCMTKAQWDERSARERQVFDRQISTQIPH